jgi:phosphoribosyl 1,2-cyclic phosphodiesterase
MRITLWGVRGSLPTPISSDIIEQKIKKALGLAKPGDLATPAALEGFVSALPLSVKGTYGGNSTCIEVRGDSGEIIIIDCGSGLKALGRKMMSQGFARGDSSASILLSHTHWDHIQGIPFFLPFYIRGNRFSIYSPFPDIKARLDHQQVFTHFPVTLDQMEATKEFFFFSPESELYLGDTRILCKRMPHPGGAYGYRVEENGRVVVFTSDCEFNIDEVEHIDDYEEFFFGADVLIFDAQYTFKESIDKFDYGHSSASIAIDIAGRFKCRRLVLFHHEPEYDDEMLDDLLINARTYMAMKSNRIHDLEIDIAREGMEIQL